MPHFYFGLLNMVWDWRLDLIMEFWVFESFCFWVGFDAPRQTEFSPCSQWYLISEMVFNQILRFFPGLSVHFKHLCVHWWVLVHCGPGIGICFFKNGTCNWVGGSIICGTIQEPPNTDKIFHNQNYYGTWHGLKDISLLITTPGVFNQAKQNF